MGKKQKPNKQYVEYTRQELRRLQYWFDGFKAAGGILPVCMRDGMMNPLHKVTRLMDEHIETSND